MNFEIRETDAAGRIGKFTVRNKVVDTPNLFPVLSPFMNDIKPRELMTEFGAQCCFTNAYLIYKSKDFKDQYVNEGVHKVLDFEGVIATDSGAFQHYMYGGDLDIQPHEIEAFQETIGSDCPVILDIPVQFTDPYEEAKRKVDITIERAKDNLTRRNDNERAWYGPIHGSIYPDLLKKSCEEMSKLDFGIYAIGGVVKSFIDYRFDVDVRIMLDVKQWLNPSKPLHLFGLGLPSFFSMAVACGADFFDSAAYILFAKEGRYFTLTGTKHISELIELPCCCPICSKYTAQELNALPEKERIEKLARHNLYLSYMELKSIKQAIREGTLWELVEQRTMAHPKLLKAMRMVRKYGKFLETVEPKYKTKGIKYLTEYSLYNPVLTRQRRYIAETHVNPTSTMILIPELDQPSYSNKSTRDWLSKIPTYMVSKKDMDDEDNKKAQPQLRKGKRMDVAYSPLEKQPNDFSVYIVSDIIGLIPLELADVYPNSQHEGCPDIYPGCSLVQEHITSIAKFLERQIQEKKSSLNRVFILIPTQFLNEFGEKEPFIASEHLIGHLSLLIKDFTSIKFKVFDKMEDLIAEL